LISQRRSMVIENASIVTPEKVVENGSIKIVDGVIADISTGRLNGCSEKLDVDGMYVMPGFVDLHGDAIEREIEPRAGALFPLNMAIVEMDRTLAASGITTMYHSLSYSRENKMVRSNGLASEIIREVNRLSPVLGVRTRVHARFEASCPDAVPYVERLLDDGRIHLLSITCHYIGGEPAGNVNPQAPAMLRSGDTGRLVDRCRRAGVLLASHDDDTEEKLDVLKDLGIRYTEFPISADIARSAAGRGMCICLGAPNVVRGGSMFGDNLKAREAIRSGYGDILCSDYAPMAIFHAIFTLEKLGILPLHQAVNMASLNPAKEVGIAGFTGALKRGKCADMIIVDPAGEVPRILATFVEGREIYAGRQPAGNGGWRPKGEGGPQ